MTDIYNEDAIAVISMTGKFPGANNTKEFWDNLKNGVESVSIFSDEELNIEDQHSSHNKTYTNADAVLDNIDMFDASFFDLSPREAEIMDPQHRLFIEACWEAMELAGYTSEKYDGTIAVYAGANLSSYMVRNLYSNPGLVEKVGTFKTMLTNGQDFLSTRVSYLMDFKGPSVNVNTLCSSSLVAIHSACQSLIDYHCDLALAGGVNIQVSKNEALFYQEGGIGASDGHCRAFDSRANGTVSGSGLGVVVLKRLEDALKDGDNIEAVIRGTAINNDGSQKNSYTAPNPDGQAECIADAIAMAEIDPESISLIEAHGTGTNLGDPIEIAGLTKAFGNQDKKQYCAIGSVKTNIGHLVTAGGVASLIKVILSMKNNLVPASLNYEKPNPKIEFEKTPFYVNTKPTKWSEITDGSLIAGISSFGIGGTNAHVIIEEAPKLVQTPEKDCWKLLILSGKTEKALNKINWNIQDYICDNSDINISDLAYTMMVGRKDFDNKQFVLFRDLDELKNNLKENVTNYTDKPKSQPVSFIISDEKLGYHGMGSGLYRDEPVFRESMDRCAKILSAYYNMDLIDYIYGENVSFDGVSSSVAQFAVNYSLAKVWTRCGVIPNKVGVYGNAYFVAQCILDEITLEDALKSVYSNEMVPATYDSGKIELLDKMDSDSFLGDSERIYIEIGFSKIINTDRASQYKILSITKGKNESEQKSFLESLAYYWLWNGSVDWNSYWGENRKKRIPLPTYPFEKQSYWIEPGQATSLGSSVEVVNSSEGLLDTKGIKEASISLSFDMENISDDEVKEKFNRILEIKKQLEELGTPGEFNVSEVEMVRGKKEDSSFKLSKQPRPIMDTEYVNYSTETQKVLVDNWQEVLGIEKVGIKDNFYELGGHSLLAASIANGLSEHFNMQLQLSQLMDNPTIESLAELIDTYKWVSDNNENLEAGELIEEGSI
ncbi:MAG: polyketide synthase [Deltaproteobacteria bacterium]|nr:polyketide synthase [Deltaproteobacteria bacterium]